MSPEDEKFCRDWDRNEVTRRIVAKMDRAIRRAQTPARLYSMKQHAVAPARPTPYGPRS